MNSITPSPALSTPADLPDYQVAANELTALFNSTGLTATIHDLRVGIDESTKSGKGWSRVAVKVTFSRPEMRTSNGADYRPPCSVTIDWKMGLGLVDWKAVARKNVNVVPREDKPRIEAMIAHRLNDSKARALASRYLWAFKTKVNPAEVLARAADDGESATSQSFESWASEYGYDTDSRKAEEIYRACQKNGDLARKILTGTGVTPSALADLARRL